MAAYVMEKGSLCSVYEHPVPPPTMKTNQINTFKSFTNNTQPVFTKEYTPF